MQTVWIVLFLGLWLFPSTTLSDTTTERSYLLLCLADGSIYSVDAWSGAFSSVIHTDPLLRQHNNHNLSMGPPDGLVVPSLDGRLYWRPPPDSDNPALQELPLTLSNLLENPVRSCDPGTNEGCGILTAQAVTSLLALSDDGELLWKSDNLNDSNTSNQQRTDKNKKPALLLQRKDYWIQHVQSTTGRQTWNVSLGTYQALDFGVSEASNSVESLLIDDDGLEDAPQTLPAVVFADAGRTLTAVDPVSERVLWSHHVPSTLSSVFGIFQGNWETVQVLRHHPVLQRPPLLLESPHQQEEAGTSPNNNNYNAEFYEEFLWNLNAQQQKENAQQRRELPSGSTAECRIDRVGNLICPEAPLRLPASPVIHVSSGILIPWELVAGIVISLVLGIVASWVYVRKRRQNRPRPDLTGLESSRQPLKRSSSLPGNLSSPAEPYNKTLIPETPTIKSDDGVAPAQNIAEETAAGLPLVRYSRYASEFEEVRKLGKGGFGSVYECKNVLDGRCYAVKKVSIRGSESDPKFQLQLLRVLREVKILAVLEHSNIVRYFTCWLEIEQDDGNLNKNSLNDEDSILYSSSLLQSDSVTQWDAPCSPRRRRSWSGRGNPLGWSNNLEVSESSLFRRPRHDFKTRTSMDDLMIFEDSKEDAAASIKSGLLSRDEIVSRDDENISATKYNLDGTFVKDVSSKRSTGLSRTSTEHKPDAVITRHTLYIQMQLCSQKTVAEFLSDASARRGTAAGPVDIPKALRIFLQIADAVRYVHDEKGLIHRDLKPSNCFMDDSGGNGTVKVGDFGLSRESSIGVEIPAIVTFSDERNDDHTAGVGTRSYASPEQMNGSDYDSSTDVFSLGIMLFELLYPMYTGMERTICLSRLRDATFPDDWEKIVGNSFPTLKGLILRMVDRIPGSRPTAKNVAKHIQTILDEFTIVSLDHHSYKAPEVVLMRIEAEHRDDVLMRTMELIKEESANAETPVDILQYGLRSGRVSEASKPTVAIMEFAIKYKNRETSTVTVSASGLASKLMERPEIFKARQVSSATSSNGSER